MNASVELARDPRHAPHAWVAWVERRFDGPWLVSACLFTLLTEYAFALPASSQGAMESIN